MEVEAGATSRGPSSPVSSVPGTVLTLGGPGTSSGGLGSLGARSRKRWEPLRKHGHRGKDLQGRSRRDPKAPAQSQPGVGRRPAGTGAIVKETVGTSVVDPSRASCGPRRGAGRDKVPCDPMESAQPHRRLSVQPLVEDHPLEQREARDLLWQVVVVQRYPE